MKPDNNACHEIIWGDAITATKSIKKESVQLIVTSPPYWKIKDYAVYGQIGHNQSYDEYINKLNTLWEHCFNVLSPGCKMAVNIGDQYVRASENNGTYEVMPIYSDIITFCRRLGFLYLGNIIWRKISTTKTTGGGTWMGSIYYPRDGYVTYEHEYIMIFKKKGKTRNTDIEKKERSKLTKEERSKWFRGIWDDIAPEKQNGHKAMFPLEIPLRLIKMYSFYDETILDPFVGSGTTTLAASINGRNSIGIEINKKYRKYLNIKLQGVRYTESETI